MKEKWKLIKSFDNYKVSNLGRVKRIPNKYRKSELILKGEVSNCGYIRVPLYRNGKQHKFSVHRLVLLAFKPIDERKQVNHIDGNKLNNSLDNLEWVNCKENMIHAFKTGLKKSVKGESCSWSKLTEKDVKNIRTKWKNKDKNMKELSDEFKINKTTVWEIIHRKIWRHI